MDPSKRLSKSESFPSEQSPRGSRIFSGVLRGRRVSCEPTVPEKIPTPRAQVVSPRFSRTYGSNHHVHVDVIISLLDSQQAGAPFAQELYTKFKEVITTDKKPIGNAACDLWRSMAKVKIALSDKKIVLDLHPDAYNQSVPEDIQDLNYRFASILKQFCPEAAVDAANWKNVDDVARFANSLKLAPDAPLARFIRSWSQDRYNGLLVNEVLTGFGFLPDGDPPPPIIAQIQKELRSHLCHFFQDDSHSETLVLPIKILDRETRNELTSLMWTLTFSYDRFCMLQQVTSCADHAKSLEQIDGDSSLKDLRELCNNLELKL